MRAIITEKYYYYMDDDDDALLVVVEVGVLFRNYARDIHVLIF